MILFVTYYEINLHYKLSHKQLSHINLDFPALFKMQDI